MWRCHSGSLRQGLAVHCNDVEGRECSGGMYRIINSLGGIEGASLNAFDDVEVELKSRRTASSLEHRRAEPERRM
ncbi:hypothetical protein BDQ12DRAFT_690411 [Crucibulum laeve]|uniref:Uncharacterized protein n=1 Tax=Crucibulum laeve TaxID=68775 RepID=A0A5C3LNL1_9AGAR|nr:hypothetical protein BDQ12DRAFT_690411 [Crucibulum laeve]